MNELDPQTEIWLKSLKLGKNIKTFNQFQNGYNFGLVFDKLNLSKGRKFKNSSDMACIFQNYKNVKDLLMQNFNVDFPINNIIYSTQQLLKKVRDECIKHIKNKKQTTLKSIIGPSHKIQTKQSKMFISKEKQITNSNKLMMSQTEKSMPHKIIQIEKKLQKFREEKTRHQLLALEERKAEIQQNIRAVNEHRQYQLSKIRNNHTFMKEEQHRVNTICQKTQQIKRLRIEKEEQFQKFMNEKKNKYLQAVKKEEQKNYYNGQQAFQLNCLQQGIELEHDPEKPKKNMEGEFNKVVVMERIKDNVKKNQNDKKERVKRQNRKNIDARQAKEKSDLLWSEINLIESYSKIMSTHYHTCQQIYKQKLQNQAQSSTIARKFNKQKFVDLPQFGNQEERQAELRKNRIIFFQKEIQRMQKRNNAHKSYAEEILDALITTAIIAEQNYQKNLGFSFQEWKWIEDSFMGYQRPKSIKKIANNQSVNSKQKKDWLKDYINLNKQWKCYTPIQTRQGNKYIAAIINTVIQISYPQMQIPKGGDIPLYMPLKIAFLGNRLTGKTTLTTKISSKYGLTVIDPTLIIKQALQRAKPPPPEDNKKAPKKQAKKPEEESPQILALKEYGVKLLEQIQNIDQATPIHYIDAIKFKIKQSFPIKSKSEIVEAYNEAKQKQDHRFNLALKQFEQNLKKPKKDSKKGNEVIPGEQPVINPYFYTSGFIIDGFPFNLQNLKMLERQLNNFIEESQRLNPKAQQIKQMLSLIVPLPKKQVDNNLHQGTFNLLFELTSNTQSLEIRNKGRKIDPQTNIIYHPTFNPIPTDVKGLAEKLVEIQPVEIADNTDYQKIQSFYSHFGDNRSKKKAYSKIATEIPIQDTIKNIQQIIQSRLISTYQQINSSINTQNVSNQQNIEQPAKEQSPWYNLQSLIKQLSKESCADILSKYIDIYEKYTSTISQCIGEGDDIRIQFQQKLMSAQRSFMDVINRPNDKAGKILTYQDNYNKLQAQKLSIVKDTSATKHLIERIQELNDQIWQSLEKKKDEAVTKRIEFIKSDWLNNCCVRLDELAHKFIQLELNYLAEQLYFIFTITCAQQSIPIDFLCEYLSFGIPPKLQPIPASEPHLIDRSNLQENKRLDFIIKEGLKQLESIKQWIKQKEKKLKLKHCDEIQALIQKTIEWQQIRVRERIKSIQRYTKMRILQEKSYYESFVNKMDDWIYFGVKSENDFIYAISKAMKNSIQQAVKCNIKEIRVKPITDMYPPLSLTTNPIPIPFKTKNMTIYHHLIFLHEIKALANQQNKIQLQTFISYFERRQKNNSFYKETLHINLDTLQQYLVTGQTINYRQLGIASLLIHTPVCESTLLSDYRSEIGKQFLTFEQFNVVGLKRDTIQQLQEYDLLKKIIFQMFLQKGQETLNINNYIDTLNVFNQLQVERYGDSIMILDRKQTHR